MVLSTEVQTRYRSQRMIALTNPQSSAATALDAARLTLACDDVEADFRIFAGVIYDDVLATNPDAALHINVACQGVISKLRLRMDQAGEREERDHERYLKALRSLAKVTGRDRLLPRQKAREGEEEPIFGSRRFDAYIPNSPRRRIERNVLPLD